MHSLRNTSFYFFGVVKYSWFVSKLGDDEKVFNKIPLVLTRFSFFEVDGNSTVCRFSCFYDPKYSTVCALKK